MNTTIDDGGPAFPFKCQGPQTAPEFYYGMSLRDWFAGQALAGLVGHIKKESDVHITPKSCYMIADAMLAARKGKQ